MRMKIRISSCEFCSIQLKPRQNLLVTLGGIDPRNCIQSGRQAFQAGFPLDMICFTYVVMTFYTKVGEEGNFINLLPHVYVRIYVKIRRRLGDVQDLKYIL